MAAIFSPVNSRSATDSPLGTMSVPFLINVVVMIGSIRYDCDPGFRSGRLRNQRSGQPARMLPDLAASTLDSRRFSAR